MKTSALIISASMLAMSLSAYAQTNPGPAAFFPLRNESSSWSVRMADSFMSRYPHYLTSDTTMSWSYEEGVMLQAIWKVWRATGERKYFNYVEKSLDQYVKDDGGIKTYDFGEFRLDDITPGVVVLHLCKATGDEKYKNAAFILSKQLEEQPRDKEGGFWHKKTYPNQMWLDGLYMAEPFYAAFAGMFNRPGDFNDIALQFTLVARHTRDPKTGLFYHAWDATKSEKWANPATGDSPTFWGRGMGWYMMGLVDVLDYFPKDNPRRDSLVAIFKGLATSLLKYQDEKTGLWYQVVNRPAARGNYLETSASAMFAYAFAKGFNKGYLGGNYRLAARRAFDGLTKYEVKQGANGNLTLLNTCGATGLGGRPYRDGSYEYYVSVPRLDDDFRGIGPFILAALEIEKSQSDGAGKVVCLDCYHNNEWRLDRDGREVRYHYIWEDTTNTGYSELGRIIKRLGAGITESRVSPAKKVLDAASIYIIVDPDTRKETSSPRYISDDEIRTLVNWVRSGGVLVLFANDSGNCEFTHLNGLAGHFGIHFIQDSRNDVVGKDYDIGAFKVLPDEPLFKGVNEIYMKEICTLRISRPAKADLTDGGDVIIASSHFGKGFVFAVGDPWFYNEYIDNRKLPDKFDNYRAARNLFGWLLAKAKPVMGE